MKLFVPIILIFFISLSGCKSSAGKQENDTTVMEDSLTVSITRAEFKVTGMHCSNCENAVKKNVKGVNGVKLVEASFKDSNAIVSFDPSKTNESAILSAIEDAGYKVDTFMRK